MSRESFCFFHSLLKCKQTCQAQERSLEERLAVYLTTFLFPPNSWRADKCQSESVVLFLVLLHLCLYPTGHSFIRKSNIVYCLCESVTKHILPYLRNWNKFLLCKWQNVIFRRHCLSNATTNSFGSRSYISIKWVVFVLGFSEIRVLRFFMGFLEWLKALGFTSFSRSLQWEIHFTAQSFLILYILCRNIITSHCSTYLPKGTK